MPLRAYIDESMRQRKDDDCVYVLAAALVHDDEADDVRAALKALRYRNNPTIHWYDATPAQRSMIASSVAALPITGVVAIHCYAFRGDERARRRCLKTLTRHLAAQGTYHSMFASRHGNQDKFDEHLLISLRRETPTRFINAEWRRYESEPLLWAADVLASAVSWSFNDKPEYARALDRKIVYLDAD
jgi:hypothetical protein